MNPQLDVEKISWAEIRERYLDQWVMLADIEEAQTPAIVSARVLDHDDSMIDIMDRNEPLPGTMLIQTAGRPLWWLTRPHDLVDPPDPNTTVVHTSGRPLWTPRIEIVD